MEKQEIESTGWAKLRQELEMLDKELISAEGIELKPSQCYRITNNSLDVMYNTNCPDTLREKIKAILSKYSTQDESSAPKPEFFFP